MHVFTYNKNNIEVPGSVTLAYLVSGTHSDLNFSQCLAAAGSWPEPEETDLDQT